MPLSAPCSGCTYNLVLLGPWSALHLEPQLDPQLAPQSEHASAPHLEHASVRESERTTAPCSDCTYNQLLLEPWSALTSEA